MNNGQDQQILRDLNKIDLNGIVLTIVFSWLAIALLQWLLPRLARRLPSRFRLYILPLVPILRLVILGFASVQVASMIIQPSAQNVFAIAGASAVAIGFAFKDYASSIIAGIVAIYETPYRPGDWVSIDGDYGEVKSVGLRSLQMVTADDTTITIPHAKIWTTNIANANDGRREHMCVAEFYMQPEHDAKLARQTLWDVGITSPYAQLKRPVLVIVREQLWATQYRLKAYPLDGRDEFLFISDLTVRGKAALADLGIKPTAVASIGAIDLHSTASKSRRSA